MKSLQLLLLLLLIPATAFPQEVYDVSCRNVAAIDIIREKNVFEAARAICPALVPDKVLIDGRLE